jgi:molecular chaperone GrpE
VKERGRVQKSSTVINRATDPVEPAAEDRSNASGPTSGEPLENSTCDERETQVQDMTREQLIEKLDAALDESVRNFESYLRVSAELENMKKRHIRDREETRKFSNEALIKKLLAVIDNLEQAMVHSVGEDEALACVAEGVQLTFRGLMDVLSKEGLVQIKAVGERFDPNFHEAVSEVEDDSVEAGTVVHELQRGYLLNGRLIRPAKVVVSRKSS